MKTNVQLYIEVVEWIHNNRRVIVVVSFFLVVGVNTNESVIQTLALNEKKNKLSDSSHYTLLMVVVSENPEHSLVFVSFG